jgi:hypothetical protein
LAGSAKPAIWRKQALKIEKAAITGGCIEIDYWIRMLHATYA